MAKPSSEKVGIRIQSEPIVKGKTKITMLPFHLLLVSDLTPQAPAPPDWSSPSRLLSVDKSNFSQLMQQLAPKLVIEVPNLISDAPKNLEIELLFPDMKAFRPEGIVAQIPALARLLQVRTLVQQVKDGKLDLPEFQQQAEAAGVDRDLIGRFQQILERPHPPAPVKVAPPREPSKSLPKPDKLDALLEMVNLGTGEPEPPAKRSSPFDALLQAITAEEAGAESISSQPGGTNVEKSAAEMLIAELDEIFSAPVNAILHHPEFQNLEAAWRGLRFLLDRIDFRKNIRLSVLPVRKDNLNEALYHQLLMPAYHGSIQELIEAPISAVIADFEFASTTDELQRLDDLAETMASLQVPLLAGVGPAFFGKPRASELATLPVLWQHLQRPEYVGWNALRDKVVSNYLTLALPRFLLRFPYGGNNPVKDFKFIESADHHLWGNAALALAATMAWSFAATGWPTHLSGLHDGGKIENLPLWNYSATGVSARIPLEVKLPESKEVELSEAGFAVLSCRPNHDSVYVAFAPVAHRPEKFEEAEANEEARMHATLACHLMASRIAQHLLRFERELTPGLAPEKLQAGLAAHLQALFKSTGAPLAPEAMAIEISESPEHADRWHAALRLHAPEEILGKETSVLLGLELPRV
ncbi:type VI secretion system contractile sheath large subunit [candidate division KSB1 bacterium]|nr:type VI secretion system contractile sheath large subunit [candidate division KSB1 bacterium]